MACRVRVRVGARVILARAHHVLDELIRGRVAEAELGQVGVEALGILLLEHLEPVPRPPLGVVLCEELRRVVESPVDQLHLVRRRGGVGVGVRVGVGWGWGWDWS